jgi:hypothetical protein
VSASRALRGLRGQAAIPQEDVCREEANIGKDEEGELAIVDRSVQCEDSGRQARIYDYCDTWEYK